MTEYQVKEIIRKDREERGPGVFGCVVILLCIGLVWYTAYTGAEDYKALKERVKQLEAQVEKQAK